MLTGRPHLPYTVGLMLAEMALYFSDIAQDAALASRLNGVKAQIADYIVRMVGPHGQTKR